MCVRIHEEKLYCKQQTCGDVSGVSGGWGHVAWPFKQCECPFLEKKKHFGG